ncbi:MAG: hypothetical protein AB7T31_02555 [Gemmatimonadales bacterium]
MMPDRSTARRAVVLLSALLAWPAAALQGQQPWLNSPLGDGAQPVFPFFEGWYDNGDGTYTLSFGYMNRNPETVVEIPLGERNYLEPARFDGVQPSYFIPARQRGVFAVTITEEMRDDDVWWHLIAADGSDYKVPGRARANAYQLDWNPRPHGSVAPLLWFTSESDAVHGPEGTWAPQTVSARVGQPVTLSVNVRDPSERDTTDRRFREPVPVRVYWSKHQGPEGEITFARDPGMPDIPPPGAGRGGAQRARPPEELRLPPTGGAARVQATFAAPGEYVVRAQVDNWDTPDSSSGDQCCWTNGFIRVRVTP